MPHQANMQCSSERQCNTQILYKLSSMVVYQCVRTFARSSGTASNSTTTISSNSSRLLLTAPHCYAPQLRCATATAANVPITYITIATVAIAATTAAVTAASVLGHWCCDVIHSNSTETPQCNSSIITSEVSTCSISLSIVLCRENRL
jgi:hypothetical protein